jgi:transcriptional regulator with XRE-family HTH domain
MKDEGPVIAGIFGVVLQKHRVALGISQEELAFRAEVDRTFVSRLERGLRQPTITTLFNLGDALGVAPATLVLETERAWGRRRSSS